jgi:hypothetical protein
MKSFLNHIVLDIDSDRLKSLKDECFVFPTRRACLHFTNLLSQRFADQAFISPTVISIEEFVELHARGLVVANELSLLFKLFAIYKQVEPGTTFDNFYAWGQTLLKDFDELDRYLVDTTLLYKNLQDIDDIEATFGPNEEVINAVKQFQQIIDVSADSDLYQKFMANWLTVGKVLPLFRESLGKEGLAYKGMCYRQVAEELQTGHLTLPYRQVIFAGFNALSKSEEQIFDALLGKNLATLYFDADRYYLDSEIEEAGNFLRQLYKKWRSEKIHWVITDGFAESKNLSIRGMGQRVAQAKQAASIIQNQQYTGSNTAVIMADESLLFPVLYAIPPQANDLNITMGYPVASAGQGNLILAYFRYQATIPGGNRNSQNPVFDLPSFKQLIRQSILQDIVPGELDQLTKRKSAWLPWQKIQEKLAGAKGLAGEILAHLLTPAENADQALRSSAEAILKLHLLAKEPGPGHGLLHEQLVATAVQYLQGLATMLNQAGVKVDFNILERLVKESIKQLKVPFAGEPLVGLQLMGFLETRTLDFENIIVLSVNENLLPSQSAAKTYLPFGIRKAFGLPTFIEHNSIYAYHFFRLLQRAKNITLLYNAELAFDGSGEKSRFILQLINKFGHPAGPVNLSHNVVVTPLDAEPDLQPTIVVEKNGRVLEELADHKRIYEQSRALSPTALINYIECSLKYYFSRVLKIRQPDEDSPNIDAKVFGNILHEVMERVYEPFVGISLAAEKIEDMLKTNLPAALDAVFSEYQQYNLETSEVSFTRHVIADLASRILQNDSKDAPLTIIDLESKGEAVLYKIQLEDGSTIQLGGKIDRLDQIENDGDPITRVLDYKTGIFELKKAHYYNKVRPVGEYIDAYFSDPKYKSGFQTYFYALLHKKARPNVAVTGGIYDIKNINRGIEYLRQQCAELPDDILNEFELQLKLLLSELFNPDIPFEQTEDTKRCLYCDFKRICKR